MDFLQKIIDRYNECLQHMTEEQCAIFLEIENPFVFTRDKFECLIKELRRITPGFYMDMIDMRYSLPIIDVEENFGKTPRIGVLNLILSKHTNWEEMII